MMELFLVHWKNYMLAKLRRDGHIALVVASSGIASTAHSVFKLPLDLHSLGDSSLCKIKKNDSMARVLLGDDVT